MDSQSPFPGRPVTPHMLDGAKVIHFRCHRSVSCWNACCSNIDIPLTPYDILRLKKRLDISSTEFLEQYTDPFEMEKDGIAGVKLKPVEGGTACRFMKAEGCGVYEDRPTACRYYPVALLSMRRQDEYVDRESYALVREPHCLGHLEPRSQTIDEYRAEQGLPEYDELARGWRQLVLKRKSSGPTIGKPSVRSRSSSSWPATTSTASASSSRATRSTDLSTCRSRSATHYRRRHRADALRLPLPASRCCSAR